MRGATMSAATLLVASAGIGVVAAWLAGRFMRGNGFGLLGDIVAGVLGAVVGGFVLGKAGVDLGNGVVPRLAVASLAAAIVLFLVHVLTSRRHGQRSWQ